MMDSSRNGGSDEAVDSGWLGGVTEGESWLRLCDVVVSSLALLVMSPFMLLIALAIKLDSRGPVFYRQLRIGVDRRENGSSDADGRRTRDMGGRPFMLYKFRTMRTDAEEDTGPVWSGEGDDRVTRVGRFLRRHRLDELPQLWNVLKGDMSVVGPRPERPSIVHQLRADIQHYLERQRVRPGITGWAQINQGSDQTVDDVRSKLEYDLEYVRERSLPFDLRIMARTLPVMVEPDRVQGKDGLGERIEPAPVVPMDRHDPERRDERRRPRARREVVS